MATEGSGASRGSGDGLHNEDVFVVEEGLGLYVVCDGASGTPAGEIAARIAAGAVEEFVERADEQLDFDRAGSLVVERAMLHALHAVLRAEQEDPELNGLTTTVTMMLAHRRVALFGHWGDSRAYLFRYGRAHQLTIDHELTHATETEHESGEYEVFAVDLEPGDTVVLCTDGAERVVQDPEIGRVAASLSPRLLASRIVSEAHRAAPAQDATVVAVRLRGPSERGWLELSMPSDRHAHGRTLSVS